MVTVMVAWMVVLVGCYPTPTPVATLTPGPTVTAVGPVATSSPAVTTTCNPWPTFWPTDIEGPNDWGTMCPVSE